MNQHQRKFLLEEIEKQYRNEKQALSDRRPKPPSLNNYLIAAILDGTAKMNSFERVQQEVREKVRDLGKGETFVGEKDRWLGSRDTEEQNMISIPALLLFEMPPQYQDKVEEYNQKLEAWKQEAKALESSIAAMRIKVQVGSDKALSALVEQADKICSMSLTAASRMMLTNGEEK